MTDAPPGTVSPSLAPSLVVVAPTPSTLLLCLSHLRWDFVFQRPQHLMSRFARTHCGDLLRGADVRAADMAPRLDTHETPEGVTASPCRSCRRACRRRPWTPPSGESARWPAGGQAGRRLVALVLHADGAGVRRPSAVGRPTVYDCMDELSAFRGAPPRLLELERELLARADLVFTGGHSLYEAKRDAAPATSTRFPTSVDVGPLRPARGELARAGRPGRRSRVRASASSA